MSYKNKFSHLTLDDRFSILNGINDGLTKTAIAQSIGKDKYRYHPQQAHLCYGKTLYNYIENDVFHEIAGITVMDLRRQVSRKLTKQKSSMYKKRIDRKYLKGRTYI